MSDESQLIRMAEALLFAAVEPLDEASLVARLPDGTDVAALIWRTSLISMLSAGLCSSTSPADGLSGRHQTSRF